MTKCFSCNNDFTNEIYKDRTECESGYGSCPNCGSQNHEGNTL